MLLSSIKIIPDGLSALIIRSIFLNLTGLASAKTKSNDPRFGIWETYKQISSYINEIIYPDFSHVNDLTFPYFFHINDNPQLHMFDIENPERKKIPSKDEIPNIYGDYTLKAPPPDEPKYKIDFSLPAEERIEQRIAENKHAIAEKCGL